MEADIYVMPKAGTWAKLVLAKLLNVCVRVCVCVCVSLVSTVDS